MRKAKFKVVSVNHIGRRFSAFAEGNYSLEFPKGSIVRAREETLGVSVFNTRKQAELFQDRYYLLKIIRVRPIGRGKTVRLICSDTREFDLDAYYGISGSMIVRTALVPLGTIFYPVVEVLD